MTIIKLNADAKQSIALKTSLTRWRMKSKLCHCTARATREVAVRHPEIETNRQWLVPIVFVGYLRTLHSVSDELTIFVYAGCSRNLQCSSILLLSG
jgi:hypothetical protein